MGEKEAGPGGGSQGRFYAVDASNGNERWSRSLGNSIQATAAVDSSTVYVAYTGEDGRGVLAALATTDGRVQWSHTVDTQVRAAPLVDDGFVYVADNRGTVYALDADSGQRVWVTADELGVPNANGLASWGPYLYLATYSGPGGAQPSSNDFIIAIDKETGAVAWRTDPTEASSTDDDFTTTPVAVGGLVFAGTKSAEAYTDGNNQFHPPIAGQLHAVDALSGQPKWSRTADDASWRNLAVADNVVYAGTSAGYVHAINAATGLDYWRVKIGDAVPDTSGATWAGGVLLVGAIDASGVPTNPIGEARLHALDPTSGGEHWRVVLDGPIRGGVALEGGRAFVHAVDAFGTDAESILAAVGSGIASHAPNDAPVLANFSPGPEAALEASPTHLQWTTGDSDDVRYDVYFGNWADAPLMRNLQTETSWPLSSLGEGHYWWRVVARDAHGAATESPVLHFSVGDVSSDPTQGSFMPSVSPTMDSAPGDDKGFLPGLGMWATVLAAALLVLIPRRE